MITFIIGLGILVLGYFIYGLFIEKQFEPDENRLTPAVKRDAKYEDRQALPHWKCMLLQLLHIAGIGPVIGVILGAKFGPVVFLIIPIGNIFAGAVHDYFSGMICMRNGAKSYLEISKKFLTKTFAVFSTIFMIVALFALSASFTNISTNILNTNIKLSDISYLSKISFDDSYLIWFLIVFVYYILSSFFPISSFLSKISNVFGFILIASTLTIVFSLFKYMPYFPEFSFENFWGNFTQHPGEQPILPMLFVTIACGIISGFHSSQNSITAGIESNEKNGRRVFFGTMVIEGFLAMIWAAVGVIGYIIYPELSETFNGAIILTEIVKGITDSKILSNVILLSVVVLAITTADAAFRVIRMLITESFKFKQKSGEDRFLLSLPILCVCGMVVFWSNIADDFSVLWNYFSLTNQSIAVLSLVISVCYMKSKNKQPIYIIIPLAFISFIVFLYLFWISPRHVIGAPQGFGLGYTFSCILAIICSIMLCLYSLKHGNQLAKLVKEKKFNPDED